MDACVGRLNAGADVAGKEALRHVRVLQRDLQDTRAALTAATEELKTTREELKSCQQLQLQLQQQPPESYKLVFGDLIEERVAVLGQKLSAMSRRLSEGPSEVQQAKASVDAALASSLQQRMEALEATQKECLSKLERAASEELVASSRTRDRRVSEEDRTNAANATKALEESMHEARGYTDAQCGVLREELSRVKAIGAEHNLKFATIHDNITTMEKKNQIQQVAQCIFCLKSMGLADRDRVIALEALEAKEKRLDREFWADGSGDKEALL